MKKSIIALLSLLVLLAAPAVSLEWGGVVKSETDYITADFNDFSIEEIGSVYLWFRTPFGKNSTFSLTGEGVYKGDVLFEGSSTTIKNILDVDLFKVGGTLFMEDYYRILKKDGLIVFKTDQRPLYEYTKSVLEKEKFTIILDNPHYNKLDKDDSLTEYESKFRKEKKTIYRLIIRRV